MPFFTHPKAFHEGPTFSNILALQNCRYGYNGAGRTLTMDLPPPPRHSSHPALPHLTMLVFEAVLEVVCVSLPGYIVARQGMFTAEMQKFAANLNVVLFTPCLIFTKLASKLDADKMVELAIIPLIFIMQTLISYLCSLLVSKLFRFPKRARNFVIAMGVFGNSNSLPISLVISLSKTVSGLHWDKIENDNDGEVQARGILYLLIFQQLGQMLRWSWGYNVLLAPPDKIEGTLEHAASCLESGGDGTEEECERLVEDSPGSEVEENYTSGSEVTRIEADAAGRPDIPGTLQATPQFTSGAQTPVTCQQQLSSTSLSKKFIQATVKRSSELTVHGPSSEANSNPGDLRPRQAFTKVINSVKAFKYWLDSVSVRCKAAVGNLMRRISHSIAKISSSAFSALPFKVQRALRASSHGLKRFGAGVWVFMNPPLWAMLAAIIVASIPDLQRLFFADGTFVKNSVTSAISQSGGVAVPLILVVLGGNLARNTLPSPDGNEDEHDGTKLLMAALISRMVLPFLIVAPLLAITAKYVPVSILDDPIFVIVCFLITGAPSALQLAQICQINNVYMRTMARLLFQSYVVWILPSTLILVMCALEVVKWAQR